MPHQLGMSPVDAMAWVEKNMIPHSSPWRVQDAGDAGDAGEGQANG